MFCLSIYLACLTILVNFPFSFFFSLPGTTACRYRLNRYVLYLMCHQCLCVTMSVPIYAKVSANLMYRNRKAPGPCDRTSPLQSHDVQLLALIKFSVIRCTRDQMCTLWFSVPVVGNARNKARKLPKLTNYQSSLRGQCISVISCLAINIIEETTPDFPVVCSN